MKFTLTVLSVAFALCALPLIGCSETSGVDEGPAGSGGDGTGGTAGSGGMDGTGGTVATRSYGLRFTEVDSQGTSTNLEGVELCQADTDNCAMSDEFGFATIEVPVNQEITFTAEKEGYAKWMTSDVSNDDTALVTNRRLYTNEQLEAITEQQLGGAYPWTNGMVALVRFPTVAEGGVTFTAVGDTANAVGPSFYYDGASEEYGTEHAATGPYDGLGYVLPFADGGFMDVTQGERVFELGGTGGDCPVSWGWHGDDPKHLRVPVRAGYLTYGSWNCEL